MDPHVCSLLLDDASSPLFLLPIAYRRGGCRRGLIAAFPRLFLQFSFKLLSRLLEALDGLADAAADLGELLGPEHERGDAGDNRELRHPEPEQALAPERPAATDSPSKVRYLPTNPQCTQALDPLFCDLESSDDSMKEQKVAT